VLYREVLKGRFLLVDEIKAGEGSQGLCKGKPGKGGKKGIQRQKSLPIKQS
jgi:hypothetical protein